MIQSKSIFRARNLVSLPHTRATFAAVFAACIGLLPACSSTPQKDEQQRFFTAWAASQNLPEPKPPLSDTTVRMIVRPALDGTALRIRVENTVASTPVAFSAIYIGAQDAGAQILSGTNRALTFDGKTSLTLEAGASAYSDTLDFPVRALRNLVVSFAVERAGEIATHSLGLTTNYYATGARANDISGAGFEPVPRDAGGAPSYPFYWISALDVVSNNAGGTIVAFGDSITDGRCSTSNPDKTIVIPDLHQRWTDVFAARLAAANPQRPRAVVNAGVAGNRVLEHGHAGPSALQRLDRDVLSLAGVTHVILFDGSNDIHRGASADALIEGTRQIVERIRAKHIKVIGGTMIPRGKPEGAEDEGFSATKEQYRQQFNAWMRTPGNVDAVIDFDATMSGGGISPTGAAIIPVEYSCDFTHPNARGYRVMGEAIDLSLFD